jgi:hypothetical protein
MQSKDNKEADEKAQPGSYYYDDATGYQLYDPAEDEEETDEDDDKRENEEGSAGNDE